MGLFLNENRLKVVVLFGNKKSLQQFAKGIQ
jgi:hypothetical protein